MNPIIDKIEILRTYYDIQHNPPKYDITYKELQSLYPDVIKKILETDRCISPKHVTQDILKKMFLSALKKSEPKFKVDDQCAPLIGQICQYLRQDPAFLTLSKGHSFDKGLFIHGKVGSGKTLIMCAMSNLLKMFNYYDYSYQCARDVSFGIVESRKISDEFMRSGPDVWDKAFYDLADPSGKQKEYLLHSKSLCVDDVGSEPIATHYSNTVNVIGDLIMDRYTKFKSKGPSECITHVTSNLNAKLLQDFYGERTFSRMKEMFNDLVLQGTDRRH